MKAKINLLLSCFVLLALITVINACSDDDGDSNPKPTASFMVSKETADVGEEITFTNTSEDATSYVWSFGDGTTSTLESPVKTYTTEGSYEVTLTAVGKGGSSQASKDITIEVADLGEIYFIDYSDAKIAKFSVSSPATVTPVLDITGNNGLALAYDETNDKIYFSGLDTDEIGGVWRVNSDGTGLTNVITDLYDPYGVALNVAGNKIYVADDADGDDVGHIYRSNLDGTSGGAVVTMDGAQFRAVALDLVHSKVYFYEVNLENLYIANLDGTNQEVVVEGAWGYAIYVDAVNEKIYFNDMYDLEGEDSDGVLKMADLDGSNIELVSNGGSRIYGITVDNAVNKVFWSERDNGEILQADLDGSNKVAIKSDLTSPRGLFLKK